MSGGGKHRSKIRGHFPQQGADRVQGTYLQAVLLLIRPILMSNAVDPDLMQLCVNFAADACEVSNWPIVKRVDHYQNRTRRVLTHWKSAKIISLNPQNARTVSQCITASTATSRSSSA